MWFGTGLVEGKSRVQGIAAYDNYEPRKKVRVCSLNLIMDDGIALTEMCRQKLSFQQHDIKCIVEASCRFQILANLNHGLFYSASSSFAESTCGLRYAILNIRCSGSAWCTGRLEALK